MSTELVNESVEPTPPYPDLYLDGLRHHNAGRFFQAHETLEVFWYPLVGGPKRFLQALIMITTAYHHLHVTKSWNGARKLFEAAKKKLGDYPSRYGGLDVDALRARLPWLRDQVDRVEQGTLSVDDPALRLVLWPDDAEVDPV